MTRFIDQVAYRAGVLEMDGASLQELAATYGTPCFVGSRARIEENVARFTRAFAPYAAPVLLSYSAKTNSNLGVMQVLERAGVTAGVCSGLDYAAARRAGFPPERIMFDGLAKTAEELEVAIRDGVALINAESWDELALIDDIGRRLGRTVAVGIRIRLGPSFTQRFSTKSLLGISYERFGFDLRGGQVDAALDRLASLPHVRLEGVHVHEGSHMRTAAPYIDNFRRILPTIRTIHARWPGALRYLNLGGGFGVVTVRPYKAWDMARNTVRRWAGVTTDYDYSSARFDLDALGAAVIGEVTSAMRTSGVPLPTLVFEPGRFVVGDAFVLVARVRLRKSVPHGDTWLVLDAGTNVFPYLLGFTEHHQVAAVRAHRDQPAEVVNLAGPLMYSSDVIVKGCRLPRLAAGDLVAILDAGAYTLAYSNQFLYPRPAAVLVEPAGPRIIREPETYDSVLVHDRQA